MPDFVGAIKAAGPAAGGLAIAFYGVYGGQYATKFKPPYDDFASGICLIAMVIGIGIATWRTIRSSRS